MVKLGETPSRKFPGSYTTSTTSKKPNQSCELGLEPRATRSTSRLLASEMQTFFTNSSMTGRCAASVGSAIHQSTKTAPDRLITIKNTPKIIQSIDFCFLASLQEFKGDRFASEIS